MFVGEAGLGRVVQRTCELMRDHRTDEVRRHGGIDLATIQRYLNFHYSVSLDLFGGEISTNAANFYTAGLKGRFDEGKKADDHRLAEATYPVTQIDGDRIVTREEPALPALNERLRDDYIADCQRGVDRWNQIIRKHGIDAELRLPHRGFHRAIGTFAGTRVSPDGKVVSQQEWEAGRPAWLPTEADQAFVESLMVPVVERGSSPTGSPCPPAASTGIPSTSSTSGADRCPSARGYAGSGRSAAFARRPSRRRLAPTPSLVSQIESDKLTPSLHTLGRLAGALGVPIAAFFEQPPNGQLHLGRRKDCAVVSFDGSTERWEVLAGLFRGKVRAVVSTLGRGSVSVPPERVQIEAGQMKLVYVLEGKIALQYNGERHLLRGRRFGLPRRGCPARVGERRGRGPPGRSG